MEMLKFFNKLMITIFDNLSSALLDFHVHFLLLLPIPRVLKFFSLLVSKTVPPSDFFS